MDNKSLRFKGLTWYNTKSEPKEILIGGAGGIGSYLSFFLSRASNKATRIFLYDFDKVEEHNIGGQLFSSKDIGSYKAQVMNNFSHFYGISKIYPVLEKYDSTSMIFQVMFSCFDNMEARKVMFENWKSLKAENKLFIDGRLLAEDYEVFFVTEENIEEYEKSLFDDSEVEEAPCSMKQTTHYAASIAADMVKGYTNWIANLNGDVRELPFRIQEIGTLFHKKSENDIHR